MISRLIKLSKTKCNLMVIFFYLNIFSIVMFNKNLKKLWLPHNIIYSLYHKYPERFLHHLKYDEREIDKDTKHSFFVNLFNYNELLFDVFIHRQALRVCMKIKKIFNITAWNINTSSVRKFVYYPTQNDDKPSTSV